jgi:hypothetical protein
LPPADVGLPASDRRRVRGISWYALLENGDTIGVSEDPLLAESRALRL